MRELGAVPHPGEEWQRRRGRRRRWAVVEVEGPLRPARGCTVRLREAGPGREEVIEGVPVQTWDELRINLQTFRADYERVDTAEAGRDREANDARLRALATLRRLGDPSSVGLAVMHGQAWDELDELAREVWRSVVGPLCGRIDVLRTALAARDIDPPGIEVIETSGGWTWREIREEENDEAAPECPPTSEHEARRSAWRAFAVAETERGDGG